MKAARLSIDNQSQRKSGLFSARAKPIPDIGGNNFFTGDYTGTTGHIGMTATDESDWKLFWKQVLGQEPPGPLPKGAMAIMLAAQQEGDPVSFEPEKIEIKDGKISIDWKRIHTAVPGEEPARAQFAVLVVPNLGDSQTYRDVFLAEEQRQKAQALNESLRVFHAGLDHPVTVLPVVRFRRKLEMARF